MFRPEIILGPPGTGKTTSLLKIVEETLEKGILPERIGYVAFTKKAATEAIERAETQFGFKEKQLPYFRTLHSLAFRMLGMKRDRVLGKRDIKEFGEILGLRLTGFISATEGAAFGTTRGDRAMFMSGLARLRGITFKQQWTETPADLEWFEAERVHRGLQEFKESRGLKDFTDMLENFVGQCDVPELDLLVVDEAQDLSALQWRMVVKMATNAKRVIVAGDDDQAIFQWAGADVTYFVKMAGNVTVLDHSYRTPATVQDVAQSIIDRVGIRRSKTWTPREGEGKVMYHTTPEAVDMDEGSWLVLARNGYLLDGVEQSCRRMGHIYERNKERSVKEADLAGIKTWERLREGGVATAQELGRVFKWLRRTKKEIPKTGSYNMKSMKNHWGVTTDAIWHDAFDRMPLAERSYMLAALRKGEKLLKTPRIQLSTIHSAKGGEADNVVLFSDMARRTFNGMQLFPDNERRVFYVGATRTRNNLNIIVPRTKFSFSEI